MAITKKLSRVGKSYSLIIDKNIMKLLNITPETELEISIKDNSIIVSPLNKTLQNQNEHKKLVREAFRKSLEKFGPVYQKLSE